jgi:hypothetical protein
MSSLHKRGGGSSSGKPWTQKLKALDAYPKINEDFFTRTLSGGIITLVSSIIMALLFFSELRECPRMPRGPPRPHAAGTSPPRATACTGLYLGVNTAHELSVDTSRGETISINVSGAIPGPSRGHPCSARCRARGTSS